MRHSWRALLVGLSLLSPEWLPSAPSATPQQPAAIAFANEATSRALNYDQGNAESLMDAQNDFTPEAWREFMKWLNGYVTDQGAPTGSSLFTATGDAVVKGQENNLVRLTIPGTLKQQSKNSFGGVSTTTYIVTVDIDLGGNPFKIQRLKARTCGAKPCAD